MVIGMQNVEMQAGFLIGQDNPIAPMCIAQNIKVTRKYNSDRETL